ncbi:hypothetical protein SynRS9915_01788 [Synechococcus sp. RS9915]|nr:hypothetical protein SynRS9915_01788 [Synechococcus sp. RS9915]
MIAIFNFFSIIKKKKAKYLKYGLSSFSRSANKIELISEALTLKHPYTLLKIGKKLLRSTRSMTLI